MWYYWALGGILALALTTALVSWRLSALVIRPRREGREEAVKKEIERGNLASGELEAMRTEEGELEATDGVKLRYLWLRCGRPTDKACVVVHGFSSRKEHVVRYAKLYLARGYDALVYDQRNAGDSGGTITTMGFLEKRDLQRMLHFAREDKGFPQKRAVVGAHGESLGAAAVLLASCLEEPPDFAVADCPFADLTEQLRYNVTSVKHLPPYPFAPVANAITCLRAGFRYQDVSPLRAIEARDGLPDVPVLFIHGEADTLIPPAASKRLYEAKRGAKELHLFPGAEHARSLFSDRARYAEILNAFLDKCGY